MFREMNRVLKPGGRLQIGDILVQKPVPEEAKLDMASGPVKFPVLCWKQRYGRRSSAAGFVDVEIPWRADIFSGAPQATSAAAFGTQGINPGPEGGRVSRGGPRSVHDGRRPSEPTLDTV